eukprot:6185838-Pleurochrysis_carterae.AAC.2
MPSENASKLELVSEAKDSCSCSKGIRHDWRQQANFQLDGTPSRDVHSRWPGAAHLVRHRGSALGPASPRCCAEPALRQQRRVSCRNSLRPARPRRTTQAEQSGRTPPRKRPVGSWETKKQTPGSRPRGATARPPTLISHLSCDSWLVLCPLTIPRDKGVASGTMGVGALPAAAAGVLREAVGAVRARARRRRRRRRHERSSRVRVLRLRTRNWNHTGI